MIGETVMAKISGDYWQLGTVTHEYGDYVVIDGRWEVSRSRVRRCAE